MSQNQESMQVTCGANSFDLSGHVGKTVAEVREDFCTILNIPTDAKAVLNGQTVKPTTKIAAGDQLEFVKEAGQKGM